MVRDHAGPSHSNPHPTPPHPWALFLISQVRKWSLGFTCSSVYRSVGNNVVSLEYLIILLQPPKTWDCRHVLPFSVRCKCLQSSTTNLESTQPRPPWLQERKHGNPSHSSTICTAITPKSFWTQNRQQPTTRFNRWVLATKPDNL